MLNEIGIHVPGGEFIRDIAVLKPGVEQDGTIVAHELTGDTYTVIATVRPGTSWTATIPFTVTLTPSELVA